MFMNTDGSIDSTVEINSGTANGPVLDDNDTFGFSVANIGDLDGDGVSDIAVGANLDDGGGFDRGAIHIMFMNTDGSVDSTVEINDGTTNGPVLNDDDEFGRSVANIGDLDGDGVFDIAVGAHGDDNGGTNRGAIHIMFMNTDGSIDSTVEINDGTTNGPVLDDFDRFGGSIANIGDLDGDGVFDIAVGAHADDNGGTNRGATHIIFLEGPPNSSPDCTEATPSTDSLWPPNHEMKTISIDGITDPDGDTVTTTITGITQDEPTPGPGKKHSPDGDGVSTDTAQIRAERDGSGDGRVYEISFTADDGNGGTCNGSVFVGVPHDQSGNPAVDSGQNYDSTQS